MYEDVIIKNVHIEVDSFALQGILSLPEKTKRLVLFAHGSGSSRLSPRNNFVARILQVRGIGTLLFDLLTEEEDFIYANRFDIDLITSRLVKATNWVKTRGETKDLSLGYFGASTGAAAALNASTLFIDEINAIVSRGGRPDLATVDPSLIKASTLFIVGELDEVVIDLNQKVYEKLISEKKLEIVPGATHLFEEPGTLEKAANLAADWFIKYL